MIVMLEMLVVEEYLEASLVRGFT